MKTTLKIISLTIIATTTLTIIITNQNRSLSISELNQKAEELELSKYGFVIKDGQIYTTFSSEIFGEQAVNIDPKTMTIVDHNIIKDKNNVFLFGQKIQDADPKTFENIISTYYSKDKNNVYYYHLKIQNADPKTFKPISASNYSKDKNHIFYCKKILSDQPIIITKTDTTSFTLLEGQYHNFAKNNQHIFYQGEIIEQADLNTFQILSDDWRFNNFSKDKNNVYLGTEIIQNADPQTFEYLGEGQAKDKNNTYDITTGPLIISSY